MAGPCVCLCSARWLGGSWHISSADSSLLAQRRQCLLDGVIKEVIDAIVIVTFQLPDDGVRVFRGASECVSSARVGRDCVIAVAGLGMHDVQHEMPITAVFPMADV